MSNNIKFKKKKKKNKGKKKTLSETLPESNHRRVKADSDMADVPRPPSLISTLPMQGVRAVFCAQGSLL